MTSHFQDGAITGKNLRKKPVYKNCPAADAAAYASAASKPTALARRERVTSLALSIVYTLPFFS